MTPQERLAQLLDPTRAPEVIATLAELVRAEVSAKSGVAGMAIKTAFKTLLCAKPNVVEALLGGLLPDFIRAITPLYEEFARLAGAERAGAERAEGGGADLNAFIERHKGRFVSALLSVTDARAARSPHKALLSVYQTLRPMAEAQVAAALPALAAALRRLGL